MNINKPFINTSISINGKSLFLSILYQQLNSPMDYVHISFVSLLNLIVSNNLNVIIISGTTVLDFLLDISASLDIHFKFK